MLAKPRRPTIGERLYSCNMEKLPQKHDKDTTLAIKMESPLSFDRFSWRKYVEKTSVLSVSEVIKLKVHRPQFSHEH